MPRTALPRFRKTLLALAASAALAPHGASWALDLAQSPPGSVEPYVAPNVIITIDDSGSMNWQITNTTTGSSSITTPNADGSWDPRAKRINVLRYVLQQVFSDTTLLPDKKIRLSWQVMWNNGNAPDARNVDSISMKTNSMRPLQGTHRTNFLNFAKGLAAGNGTPSHQMFQQADAYMRENLGKNSPWAIDPGNTGAPYLGCRRNYHIFFTDGRWNSYSDSYNLAPTLSDDTTSLTLPDGTIYGGNTAADIAKTTLYRDSNWSDTNTSTLADWAFYSWANPLQTSGLTGSVQPKTDYRQAPATENFGNDSAGTPAILDRYWNPRYNPATWPHMVTYTIGISNDATTWPYSPNIGSPTQTVPYGYDNSFLDLVTGNKTWPQLSRNDDGQDNDHAIDLWHAALNSRGRYYAIMTGADLQKAFREIIGQINTQTQPNTTSTATSGSNTTRNNVGKFTGNYQPQNKWKGFINADTVKTDGTTVPNAGWGGQTTADKLDATGFSVANRLVLSWSDKWAGTQYTGGVSFQWASTDAYLSTNQKLWLQKAADFSGLSGGTDQGATVGQQRVNYLRGDRSMEGSDSNGYTALKPYRERTSRQGDIINSVVWYTGVPSSNLPLRGYDNFTRNNSNRTAMVYVGSNDGMLHGFAAADGSEKLAYVPRGAIPNLSQLTDPQFNTNHKFFVDGSPMTGDVDLGIGVQDPQDPNYNANYNPNWRTLLVGSMGAGGKGYFVLDVTDPSSGNTGFTAANAQNLVLMDRTRAALEAAPNCSATGISAAEKAVCNRVVLEDQDIGNITARPVQDDTDPMRTTQITRMNNNRWAVVLGNGYNSANQRPVLLIQYLDGDRKLVRIPVTNVAAGTGLAADNGLSAPRLVDLNGDGRPDIAYAGDNQGNLWKFDLTNIDDTQWGTAFGGTPLFTAQGPAALGNSLRATAQPITVAPTVRANDRLKVVGSGASAKTVPVGGMMVAFGTGRNVSQGDPNSVTVQTLYSVLDNTRYSVVTTTLGKRLQIHPGAGTCSPVPAADCVPTPTALGTGVTNAKLAQQKITTLSNATYATVDVQDDLKTSSWSSYNGWYMDMPAVGERLLKPLEFFDGSNILVVYSQVPAKGSANVNANVESCDATSVDDERQYRTLVNIMDGKRPTVQLVDMNNDGIYNAAGDLGVSRVQVTKGPHNLITKGDKVIDINKDNGKENLARMPEQSLRPSWRQMQ